MFSKFFKTKSHQRKLKNSTNNTEEIYMVAKELIIELWEEEPIRLIGVSLNNLTTNITFIPFELGLMLTGINLYKDKNNPVRRCYEYH